MAQAPSSDKPSETYVPSQEFLSDSRIHYVPIEEDVVLEVQLFNYGLLPQSDSNVQASKTPLLFLHGYLDSRFSFLRTIECLGIKDRLIIVPSLRGFGDSQIYPDSIADDVDAKNKETSGDHASNASQTVTPFSLSMFVQDVIKLLDYYQIKSAVWIGHSLGSLVSHFAAAKDNFNGQTAGYVERMVLIGTGNRGIKEIGDAVWAGLKDMQCPDRAFIKEFQGTDGLAKDCSKELSYQVQRESFKTGIVPLKQAWFEACKLNGDSYLGSVLQDITVIWGTKDEVFPKIIQDEFVKLVKNNAKSVKFIEIEGKGHNTHWEVPQQVANIIKEAIN